MTIGDANHLREAQKDMREKVLSKFVAYVSLQKNECRKEVKIFDKKGVKNLGMKGKLSKVKKMIEYMYCFIRE